MITRLIQNKYLDRLSSKLHQLNLEADIFLAKANKTEGLSKAKYLERVKTIQERQKGIANFITQITERGDLLEANKFREKIDNFLKEIDEATEKDKQNLIELFN